MCLIQIHFSSHWLCQINSTVCFSGILATLAAFPILQPVGLTFFSQTTQWRTEWPFIIANIQYFSFLFVGMLSHFSGDRKNCNQKKNISSADILSHLIVEKVTFSLKTIRTQIYFTWFLTDQCESCDNWHV